ncbi:MAG TPA: DMT family transporter [Nocardioidaceae bacterium]|nr:DMT family transporter [Nocardioidaceae bacterium]
MTRTRVRAVDVALMAVGVVGVSMSGPLMAAMAVPALAIAFWRNAFGTLALTPFATQHLPGFRALSGRPMLPVGLAAVALAVHFGFWVSALQLTSVASATALVCMQAGFVVLISWARGETVSRRVLVGLGICLAGVLVVTGVDFAASRQALVGDLLALAGGVGAAVYVVAGGVVRRSTNTTVYTFTCYGLCALLLLVVCLAWGQQLVGYAAVDWWRLLALTVVAQLLGHSVFNHVLATVSPTIVSLVILLEVPGAALLAGWWLGQTPPGGVYVGLALLVGGLAVVVTSREGEPIEAIAD